MNNVLCLTKVLLKNSFRGDKKQKVPTLLILALILIPCLGYPIFEGVKYKNEVVAIFLAVLELMKLNHITALEEDGKIIITLGENVNENTEEMLSGIEGDFNE